MTTISGYANPFRFSRDRERGGAYYDACTVVNLCARYDLFYRLLWWRGDQVETEYHLWGCGFNWQPIHIERHAPEPTTSPIVVREPIFADYTNIEILLDADGQVVGFSRWLINRGNENRCYIAPHADLVDLYRQSLTDEDRHAYATCQAYEEIAHPGYRRVLHPEHVDVCLLARLLQSDEADAARKLASLKR